MKYIKPNITDKQLFEWMAYWKEMPIQDQVNLIRKYILEQIVKKDDKRD